MSSAAYCEIWGKTDKPCDRPDCRICVSFHELAKKKKELEGRAVLKAVRGLITPSPPRFVPPEAAATTRNPPPSKGSLKRPPETKAEMERRREVLRALLTKRGKTAIVPADYLNTLALKVVGTGEKAEVELETGTRFSRLKGNFPVWQSAITVSLNEDDLEHLQDALVQIRHLLNKARYSK